MRKLYTFCLLFFISTQIFSQVAIEWQNTIGGNQEDRLISIDQTTDSGFILGGWSWSNISGDKTENSNGGWDYWILKTDSVGNIQWQNTIGGNGPDYLYTIQQTSDGGYILGGYSASNISGDKSENSNGSYDFWIIKTDSLGIIQWQNSIGGSNADYLYSMHQTLDGGYILGGSSESNISGDKIESSKGVIDYWIVKVDSFGNIEWQNTIGGSNYDYLQSIQQTVDGGYILGGYSKSDISSDKSEDNIGLEDYWIIKVDTAGNIQWENTIGGSNYDYLYSIQQTFEGGYILGGHSKSNISGDKTEMGNGLIDFWMIKTDSLGNIKWQNTIGGNANDYCQSIKQTIDGGYILGGWSASFISGDKSEINYGGHDYWVVKTDESGSIQWDKTIGGSDYEALYSLLQIADREFILGGASKSNISGNKIENSNGDWDYWLVKLNTSFNTIAGRTFIDLNSNFIKDTAEPDLRNHKLYELNSGIFKFSGYNGIYYLNIIDTGNFAVYPSSLQHYSYHPLQYNVYFPNLNQTDSLNDFAFQPNGTINDLQVTINPLGPFRPGFTAHYNIHYRNIGTTSISGSVVFKRDSVLSYVSSPTTPSTISSDSVVWNLPTLNPFDEGNILLTVNVSTSAVLGSTINSMAIIEPIAGDTTPLDNESTWPVTVTGSYDPNDILVSREIVYNYELLSPPYLDYLIRFQNTGTDTAFTVKIKNPLPVNAQLNSIEFINSSHPVQLNYNNDEQMLWFEFNNILLPDSNTNELLSHGFVRYRIKPKSTLVIGNLIENSASIFFDFNAPVITNTAVTEIIPPFTPTITPTNLILCPNESDTLWTQVYDSYQWYKDGVAIPGANQQYLVVDYFNDAGYYFKVEVDSAGFFETSDSVLVDGWAFLPVFVIQEGQFVPGPTGEMLMCPGDTVYLILGLPYDTNIQWTENGNVIPGATNDTLVVTQSGLYHVTGSPSQCPNYVQGLFDDITVIVQGPPMPVISLTGNNLTTQAGYTYQWYHDGNPLSINSNTIPLQGPGTYTVTITDANGCTAESNPFVVTSVIENPLSGTVSVNYNSSTQTLHISRSNSTNETEFYILDALGRVIADEIMVKGVSQSEIQLQSVKPGIYFVKTSDGGNSVKFLVE